MTGARKARLRSKAAAKACDAQPGDEVLIGMPGVSQPRDWFIATVLLVRGDEVATEHYPASNFGPQRQFLPIDHIRAIGAVSDLWAFKKRCMEEAKEFSRAVDDATQALGAAREAVWDALTAMGGSVPVRLPAAEERLP